MSNTKDTILETSLRLFAKRGYEKTPVSLILEQTGLSKGGFYHHFKSKKEILDALARARVDQAIEIIDPIVYQTGLSAVEKLNSILIAMLAFRKKNAEKLLNIYAGYLKNENLHWKNKIDAYTLSRAVRYYTTIIEQGVNEGFFKVQYPELTAETIIREAPNIRMKMVTQYLNRDSNKDYIKQIEKLAHYLEDFFHLNLGAKPGTIKVADVFINFFSEIKSN